MINEKMPSKGLQIIVVPLDSKYHILGLKDYVVDMSLNHNISNYNAGLKIRSTIIWLIVSM